MKVLFASAWSLLDTTNGGATSMRRLLQGLAARGHRCEVVSSPYVSAHEPPRVDAFFAQHGVPWKRASGGRLTAQDGPVRHLLPSPGERLQSPGAPRDARAERALFALTAERLAKLRPDVVLLWGRHGLEARLQRQARAAGAITVYSLMTTTPPATSAVRAVDALMVPSSFLAGWARRRYGRAADVVPPIVDPARCRVRSGPRTHVTLLNPCPEKGLLFFLRLAEQALVKLPRARFLAVEGRLTLAQLRQIGFDPAAFPNVEWMANQPDVRRVYRRTRVLLFPSLWPEVFGMGVVEAQLNGIPVLASRRGGLPEAVSGGAPLLEVPRASTRDWLRMPTAREVAPWLARLAQLTPARAYATASRQARTAAEAFDPERILDRAEALLARVSGRR